MASGASCTFSLLQGFNMSDLAQFAHYTGSPPPAAGRAAAAVARAHPKPRANGGATGPLNSARLGALWVAPLVAKGARP